MYETIKSIVAESVRTSKPLRLLEGVVVTSPPELSVRLGDDIKRTYPREFLLVAEHLGVTSHEFNINGQMAVLQINNQLKVGDRIMVAALQGGQSFFILDRVVTYGT
ncbi:DUF2577 family protein [Paenibacillus daejeonensis]|uniref:DUF2577 family protein n=1 Tax=Paenibacillus daejeonensis TaxID=135193 RepID=UPI00035FAE9A|nr:DUF2577 family protein [Paenibacillus daejeonensis]